jgi:hypothetical protein
MTAAGNGTYHHKLSRSHHFSSNEAGSDNGGDIGIDISTTNVSGSRPNEVWY